LQANTASEENEICGGFTGSAMAQLRLMTVTAIEPQHSAGNC
jgi:hypothetical protein